MELSTFKNILSDLLIKAKNDFCPDDSSAQVLKSPTANVLTAARLTKVEKKTKKKSGGLI